MDWLRQDLRFALRSLKKNLSVTVLAVGSLALAIAGNIIVFSLINGLLYRPLPFEEPDRLVLLGERTKETPEGQISGSSAANFLDWRERQTAFEYLAGFRGAPMSLTSGDGDPEPMTGAAVSAKFFDMLGSRAAKGRLFLEGEDIAGRDKVAVLTHSLWTKRGGGPIEGETLELNGEIYDVVGVLSEEFEFLNPNIETFVPLVLDRATVDRQARNIIAVGRLKDGVTDNEAQAEMSTIMAALEEEFPEANRGYVVDVLNLRHDVPDSRNRVLLAMLQGALLFVMLIACANIANLLLARSQAREREIAIRASIGATRRRIVLQLLTESLLMAALAGGLGLSLGKLGNDAVARALGALMPASYAPVIDTRVLAFTLGVTLFGGLLFAVAPILQTSRFEVVDALKDGSRGVSGGRRRRLLANGLVVGEIALALVLLGGASVLIQSFQVIQRSDPGFDTSNILTLVLNLPEARYGEDARLAHAAEEIQERLAGLPGVSGVTLASALPRTPFAPQQAFTLDARPPADGQSPPQASSFLVDPAYFETLGIPIFEGRAIAAYDRAEAPKVAVINQAMAERFWGEESPLGERLTLRGISREIVGVVGTVRHGLAVNTDLAPTMYLPLAQTPPRNLGVAIKTETDPEALAGAVRGEIKAFDGALAVQNIQTLDDFMAQFFVGQHVFTAILGGFGFLALFLAALGTYGILAYSVMQRTHEIGVRMAIGAQRGRVIAMVTRQGLVLFGFGLLFGLPLVALVTRGITAQMSIFAPVQPTSIAFVVVVLFVVTLGASLLPARRAASVDPIEALRAD